jgi:adenylylsulfate kinase
MEREKDRVNTHEAPRDIYKKGAAGSPVPGMTVPYEEPLNPEILIDTDKASMDEIRKKMDQEILRLKG